MENIFIVNPKAGLKKGQEILKELNNLENSCFYVTEEEKKTKEFVNYITKQYPKAILYSIGGDGTLNQIVNGINDSNVKLHVVPFGSGNDYYKVIKDFLTEKVDIGEVNGHKFINIASLGIDADIVERVNRDKLYYLKYQRNILKTLLIYQKKLLEFENKERLINILAVCKGKYYGNGVPINPNYCLNNGKFNIIEAGDLNLMQMISCYLKIFKGTHLNDKHVDVSLKDSLEVKSLYPIFCNVDGEVFTDTEFQFRLIKDGITITNEIPSKVKRILYR